jgi:hypothetical protein
MTLLHDDPQFRFELLADLAGVDTGATMQVVYHLWSPLSPDWVRVIADGLSRDEPRVPSVTFLWVGAEWAEREAYDMFGIIFEGNRDLRRIYLPPDFQSFPLRKDFLLADDAARSPGMGVRHMEQPAFPGDARRRPVLRSSPGTGALLGADGEFATLAAGTDGRGNGRLSEGGHFRGDGASARPAGTVDHDAGTDPVDRSADADSEHAGPTAAESGRVGP